MATVLRIQTVESERVRVQLNTTDGKKTPQKNTERKNLNFKREMQPGSFTSANPLYNPTNKGNRMKTTHSYDPAASRGKKR
jgi:hypothetical protein